MVRSAVTVIMISSSSFSSHALCVSDSNFRFSKKAEAATAAAYVSEIQKLQNRVHELKMKQIRLGEDGQRYSKVQEAADAAEADLKEAQKAYDEQLAACRAEKAQIVRDRNAAQGQLDRIAQARTTCEQTEELTKSLDEQLRTCA